MKTNLLLFKALLAGLMLMLPNFSFAQQDSSAAQSLPLSVLEFTARNQDQLIVLEWTSIDELRLSHYAIEYAADGKQYQQLLKAPSSGRAHDAVFKYTITDFPVEREHHHYKLVAYGTDGRREEKATLRIGRAGSLTTSIYPNPARKDRYPSVIPSDKPYQILLCDGSGKVTKEYRQPKRSSLLIPIGDIKEGLHLLRIYRQQ